MNTHIERHINRLVRVAQGRYIQRDQPVPLHILAELHSHGVYLDTLQESTNDE